MFLIIDTTNENLEYLHPHYRRPREIAELPTHRNPSYLTVSSPVIRRQSEHEVIVRVFTAHHVKGVTCEERMRQSGLLSSEAQSFRLRAHVVELSFVDWLSTREEAGVRGGAGLFCGLLSFFLLRVLLSC